MGIKMTYNINKICIHQNTVHTSHQQVNSTNYTEVIGSKCNLSNTEQRSMNIVYKYNFQAGYDPSTGYDQYLLHMKLQSSNDNFSSDINDVPNCKFNISHDTSGAGVSSPSDYSIMTYTAFMIIENFNKNYLRLVVRAYNTSSFLGMLNGYTTYDGAVNSYYYPSLLQVVEV